MDVAKLEKEWAEEFKEAKSAVPADKELLGEISGVQGALARLKIVKATVDEASAEWEKLENSADKANEDLRKALALLLSSVVLTEKEVGGFEAVAKKLNKPSPLSAETSRKLKKLSDAMKALKNSL